MTQLRNKEEHGGPGAAKVRTKTVDSVKTDHLNGIDKCPNGLLLHTILGVDSIDNLYMFQESSCDEPALKDTLARIEPKKLTTESRTYFLLGRGIIVS